MTGTPEGVGVLERGAVLVGTIAGVGEVRTRIA
jgi:fumarylpyruvate hydrolase